MNPNLIYSRLAETIVLPPSGEAIFILSISYTESSIGKFQFDIRLVGYGTRSCNVSLVLKSGEKSKNAAIGSSGFLDITFQDVSFLEEEWVRIKATNSGVGTTGKDEIVFSFPFIPNIKLLNGTLASFDTNRFKFLCGNVDRMVHSKLFNQLVLEPLVTPPAVLSSYHSFVYGTTSSDLFVTDTTDLFEKARENVGEFWNNFKEGKITYSQFLSICKSNLKKIKTNFTRNANEEEKNLWNKSFNKKSINLLTLSTVDVENKTLYLKISQQESHKYNTIGNNTILDFDDTLIGYLLTADDFQGKVGLLFHDRLRFQPSGIVLGEQIFTMSLSPGEEVELHQVVETKRKSTIEDIIDREQEVSLNLTSSWTNDITEGITSQNTVQTSIDLSSNADLNLPLEALPIGFGINVSNSVSEGAIKTQEQTRKNAYERTTKAASNMRSQHKVRMEVTRETGSSLATTRKIINNNKQRNVTHIFSKIYRKERVTLERYNVQLCFKFTVDDPAVKNRSIFIANVNKFDPNNPDHYLTNPKSIQVSKSFEFDIQFDANYQNFDTANLSWIVTKDIDLKRDLGEQSIPQGYILGGFNIEVIEFTIIHSSSLFGFTTSEKKETKTGHGNFQSEGGDIRWESDPPLGGVASKAKLRISFPSRLNTFIVGDEGKIMTKIKAKISASWVPDQITLDTLTESNNIRKNELLQGLNEEIIFKVKTDAIANYSGFVLSTALSENLDGPADLVQLRGVFDFENIIIESSPYWVSENGLANYLFLESRLAKLPISLPIADILVDKLISPQACVYIPIFPDREGEALQLLRGVDENEQHRVVTEIQSYRNTNYSPPLTILPSVDELLSPKPIVGTSVENSLWGTEWEKPQEKFDVLAHWQLLTPTDGVHVETKLSDNVNSDEHQTLMLKKQILER